MSTPVSSEDSQQPPETSPREAPDTRAGLGAGFRIVSLCTLASRVLGLARDMAMAALFGAGPVLDAFTVAFRLPNLARRLFGEGAMTSAFLPIFVRELHGDDPQPARRLATAVFLALAAVLLVVVGVAEVLIGLALSTLTLSADARLLLQLLAILTPYLLFICLAAHVSAMLHSLQHFTWPALLPIVLNLAWLAATLIVAVSGLAPVSQIRVIAASLVAAGVLQLALALAALHRQGFRFTRSWQAARPRVREVFHAMLPIVLGLSITQLNTALDSLLAWLLAAPEPGALVNGTAGSSWLPALVDSGTASALYFGQRMYQFPLGVFGVALGTVLFPLLARHAQRGDHDALRADLSYGVRLTISIGVPAAAGLYVLSEPITALLFQHGRFSAEDARLTSQMVAVYGAAVWAFIGLLIIHRGFYAVGDRTTPVKIGLLAVTVNLVLNVLLVWLVGGVGLAIATSFATVLQCVLAALMLQKRTGRLAWREISATAGKTLIATAAMTAACLILSAVLPAGESIGARALAVAVPVAGGFAVYLTAAVLLRLREPWAILSRKGAANSK